MIPELTKFEQQISLIMASGVQFLDLGLQIEARKEEPGQFATQEGNGSLIRLKYDTRLDDYVQADIPGKVVKSAVSMSVDESLKLLDKLWLPIPIFKKSSSSAFSEGPVNWARARIVELESGESPENSSHRVTVAIDTSVYPDRDGTDYLAPTLSNVNAGASYALAWESHQMHWFTESIWVNKWLEEVFVDNATEKLGIFEEDIEQEIENLSHHAHYLNWLSILGEYANIPEIKIILNSAENKEPPIQVDMVLDVGNSRTCGILIEEHPQESDGMKKRYELELRDLSEPHQVYAEPFESRLEFAQANFGKDNCSVESGRNDAFVWPTFARVGKEASRLASCRRGTEGPSGLSSPKRYLWDEEPFKHHWRFSKSFDRSEREPYASAAPFNQLINSIGGALYNEPEDDDPVFHPTYSRSSLMMFMLAEVLTQALSQMNSPAQRLKQSHASRPRHLRNIIITIPPSMPIPEREIYRSRIKEAVGLVWKALNWHPEDDPIEGEDASPAWPPFPEINLQWDEATCGQAVYLYTEIINNFNGRPEEFFATMRRNTEQQDKNKLTIATIDIGGGTTDLVISDYSLDAGKDGIVASGAYIVPKQRFRDGFKIAGDEIVFEIIEKVLIPTIRDSFREIGLNDSAPLLSQLLGTESDNVSDNMHRQQFTLQILYPAALKILSEFENYDPIGMAEPKRSTFRELLEENRPPTQEVLDYFTKGIRREMGDYEQDYNILDISVTLDLHEIYLSFIQGKFEICKTIKSLCEIIYHYNCDVLLLTGRPSKLPGIQALLRGLLPLPPSRIIPLQGYRTGSWYPFHKSGKIDDPKTTAAVGAMLCRLGQGRIPNFFFRSDIFKPYSTVKYMGQMENNIIKSSSVYYSDIDLNNPDYNLPETGFEMRGKAQLGFRQFNIERWGGSPLYVIDFKDEKSREKLFGEVCHIYLEKERSKRKNKESNEKFSIRSIESEVGKIDKKLVKLQLNTLTNVGFGDDNYWLDSGSVYR